MTLRARLVAGLVALMVVGLAIFGLTTYELYSRRQYRQLNSDLQSSVPPVTQELAQAADVSLPPSTGRGTGSTGFGSTTGGKGEAGEPQPPPGGGYRGGPSPSQEGGPGGPAVLVPPGTYGELLSKSDGVLSSIRLPLRASAPDVAAGLAGRRRGPDALRLGWRRGHGLAGTTWCPAEQRGPGRRRPADRRRHRLAQPAGADRVVGGGGTSADPFGRGRVGIAPGPFAPRARWPTRPKKSPAVTWPNAVRSGRRARRWASWRWRSTPCSTKSSGLSPKGTPPRDGFASSWPTRRTNCARRSPRSRVSPSCSASAQTTPGSARPRS